MTTCPKCGTKVLEDDVFCPNCGSPLGVDKKESPVGYQEPYREEYAEKPYDSQKIAHRTVEPLVARNYWLWFLISLVISPFMYVYYYFNFEDLNRLAKYDRPPGVPSPEVDMSKLLILVLLSVFCGLGIFILPYIFYLKFNNLHEYIENHEVKVNTRAASGKKYVTFYIISIVLAVIGSVLIALSNILGVFSGSASMSVYILMIPAILIATIPAIVFAIYSLIQNYRWQESYNELAYKICPETIQKDLF